MNPNPALSVQLVILEAQIRALSAALEVSLKELGIQNIEGNSCALWIHQRTMQEIQTVLIAMENQDPRTAAIVQEHLDRMINKFSDDSQ